MRHIIRGKRWTQRWRRLKNHWGWCVYDGKEIQVAVNQDGSRLLETLIHEFLHAAFDIIDEAIVTEVAKDMTRYLERNGLSFREE